MASDARAPRRRGRLRRSLPLVFGLPLLALVISAMYWHSVLASALTPTRPSTAAVAIAPVTDHGPALAGDVSDSAGLTTSIRHDVQGAGHGSLPEAADEQAGGVSGPEIVLADGVRPAASGPRAPPRPAA
jgi:hypothetical protein